MSADRPAQFSDHLVFVDESGDHGLEHVSQDYLVFVLLFAIFRKDDYVQRVCRNIQQLKLKFWGHDEVVLHEHELRKPPGTSRFSCKGRSATALTSS